MCHTPLLIVIHFRWENIINWHATHSTVLVRKFMIWSQGFHSLAIYIYIYQENIQIMKTQCCIIVVSIAKLRVVLQMCLQTISSSVLSSDSHLKPACVCKFNLGSLYVIMKIVITTLIRLQVFANCWYESYLRAFKWVHPLKTTKTGSKYDKLLRGGVI